MTKQSNHQAGIAIDVSELEDTIKRISPSEFLTINEIMASYTLVKDKSTPLGIPKTEYDILYAFALDMYGHEDTAKAKVESYLKTKNA